MSSESSSGNDSGAETRDELLRVADLWDFFCERTIADARHFLSRESNSPSLVTILACAAFAAISIAIGQHEIFYLLAALTAAQVLWFLVSKANNGVNSQLKTFEKIRNGDFPAETRESLIKRLRWWNYLIVPAEWTQNSRLFDLRKNMETRKEEIAQDVKFWQSDEGKKKNEELAQQAKEAEERKQEQTKKLRYLQTRGVHVTAVDEEADKAAEVPPEMFNDPDKLTRQIITVEQRDAHLARIISIPGHLERLQQETVFIDAMLLKVQKIADLLDNIVQLRPALENFSAGEMNESVRKAIAILEQRRQLVNAINRIRQADVLKLLGYNINYIKEHTLTAAGV